MINSRDINDLLPHVADLCWKFIAECKRQGVDILITSTYRDNVSQDALYALGRTKPGKIVTKARGGESYHNYRMAFDFVPLVHGKAVWDDQALFRKCRRIGEQVGLKGLSFEDAHLQDTGGLTIAELKAGRRPAFA